MTWARRHQPELQQAISEAYLSIGRKLNATVVAVGQAWQRFQQKLDRPVLHDRAGSHPALAGSYLAACVFLGVMLTEHPIGIKTEVVGSIETDRTLLQKTAWQVSQETRRPQLN